MIDVIERLQKAETRPLDADGKTQLWETLQDARAEIARLRLAIRRIAEQDATLSVCEGNVTVTVDATLTDAEREAVERGYCSLMGVEDTSAECTRWDAEAAATLRGLLSRMGDCPTPDNAADRNNGTTDSEEGRGRWTCLPRLADV